VGGFALAFVVAVWASAAPAETFVDPTARIEGDVTLGDQVYVAPFARLRADKHAIHIGNESDVQDNVALEAKKGDVRLGEQVILAHGASVNGPASLGEEGHCPGGAHVCPSFVGFNAMVDGAIIEKDAMVLHLARVAPGVTIPSGRKVLSGKNVASDAEVATKTAAVTDADRLFMDGVIEVNVAFAEQYAALADPAQGGDPRNVRGINVDPGNTAFNPVRNRPTLNGVLTRDPAFRNRIIGDVRMSNSRAELGLVMGDRISLRADEGEPFEVGSIDHMDSRTVFHALEHTHLQLGDRGSYGERSLVHGGPTDFASAPIDATITGDDFQLGERAVFFRSRIGNNSSVGERSLVQQSDFCAGTVIDLCPSTVILDREVWINSTFFGRVEW
jgi:carbonic anhydrase/acetyltransferase-like protein (isoleucine patch superfamily)